MGSEELKGESGFPTTPWPSVLATAEPDPEVASQALDEILRAYQTPLRIHLARKFSMSEEDSADCFQAFIHRKILQKRLLARADWRRGRFRTFLLTALDRFVVSEHRYQNAQRRAPVAQVALDDVVEADLPELAEPPSAEFDLSWARTVLAAAAERMRDDCHRRGLPAVWGVFEERLLKPLLEGASPTAYEEMVARYHLESPSQAFNALVTGKRMFARNLRAVIRQYARTDEDAEAEIQELRAILERA